MTLNQWLNLFSAAAVFLYGVGCLIAPAQIAKMLHHTFPDARGLAEFRIAQGGLFVGLGLVALILRDPAIYKVLAAGWFGAGITRLLTLVLDRPKVTPDFLGFGVFEFLCAILSLV